MKENEKQRKEEPSNERLLFGFAFGKEKILTLLNRHMRDKRRPLEGRALTDLFIQKLLSGL